MKIRKAVITAASPSQRALPLQTLVDRDGVPKTALRIIVEEAIGAGAESICVLVCPGDEHLYAGAVGDLASRIQFVEQREPRGYGHALYCAREFVGGDPFLHFVGDHLYISRTKASCTRQLVEVAAAESCAVSAVMATRETQLHRYGTVGGLRIPRSRDLYEIENVVEKPTPTEAEQSLVIPGLRAGHYLCLFGIHVLTPGVMDLLDEQMKNADGKSIQLSPALAKLASRERYLALQLAGTRHDIGAKYGLLIAQLALAMDGADRDEILAQLVELLADRQRTTL